MEGIARAKAEGKYKGRKQSVDGDRVRELYESGMGATKIAKELRIGRASVYRYLN
jgi:DNA invertase Pin-like site-specific DNA recombinase